MRFNLNSLTLFFVGATSLINGCQNTLQKNNAQTSAKASPSPSPSASSNPGLKPTTGRITPGANASAKSTFDLFFDASKSLPITQFCNTLTESSEDDQAKPCFCEFSWVDPTLGTTAIARKVQSSLLVTQRSVISCELPAVFDAEIKDGTKVEVSVVKSKANPVENFSRVSYTYAKNPIQQVGDFTDSEGFAYQNVYRYACYERFKRGLELRNQWQSVSSTGGTAALGDIVSINNFCYRKSDGKTSEGLNCALLPNLSASAQSYYYNFYSPSKILTDLSSGNDAFHCPEVHSKSQQLTGGTQKPNWPLDSQFALAIAQNPVFSVPVEAYSRPYPSTQTNVGSRCIATKNSAAPAAGKFVISCMGFAAVPNPDGSCPSIKNTNGANIPMFRVRRYVAVLPPKFEPNGEQIAGQGQLIDVAYVQDRPFGSDESPSDSVLGPKPCPFALYDHSATVFNDRFPAASSSGKATYIGLSRRNQVISGVTMKGWKGLNADGTEFPFGYSQSDTVKSAPALKPVFTTLGLSAKTLDINNRLYVRPFENEVRIHYEEDHSFLACAPRSNNYREPPLHFYKKDNNDVRWCAEVYPNFNEALGIGTEGLPKDESGTSVNFANSAAHCGPGADLSTCKRSVASAGSSSNDSVFPLLASGYDVEELLATDNSYSCKRRNASGTPSQGCCSNVSFPQGLNSGAHLEPHVSGSSCQTPSQ